VIPMIDAWGWLFLASFTALAAVLAAIAVDGIRR
jgi:hypothetical protein